MKCNFVNIYTKLNIPLFTYEFYSYVVVLLSQYFQTKILTGVLFEM